MEQRSTPMRARDEQASDKKTGDEKTGDEQARDAQAGHDRTGDERPRPEPAGDAFAAVPAIAVAAAVLWQRFLCFDPADPAWPDRDRFVLSSGRFTPLLHWLLHHAGVAPPAPDCSHGRHPALETEAGPPGQGFATAVGLAMGERMLAGRFGRTLVDHRTWVLACETDLAAGVSLEAAELAGRMELGKLTVLFEPSGDGSAPPDNRQDGRQDRRQDGPDAATRFAAAGWAVRQVDASDPDAVAGAIARAQRNRRPTLIACQPGPAAADLSAATIARDRFGWSAASQRGVAARRGWLKRLARHRLGAEFERQGAGRLPAGWHRAMLRAQDQGQNPAQNPTQSPAQLGTLDAARQDARVVCGVLPEAVTLESLSGLAIGGSDSAVDRAAGSRPAQNRPAPNHPAPNQLAPHPSAPRVPASAVSAPATLPTGGRHLFCGVQEHGMAAISNGLALHGGLRPILSASVVSIDRMRPALRLAALMRRPVVYLLADRAPGNAGWPPVEQFASLRAMPHVALFRPADPVELAACWRLALEREGGPSLLALSDRSAAARQAASTPDPFWRHEGCAQGGYVLADAVGRRDATLIATGPEVAEALAARRLLARAGVDVAVVSLPCWELFADRPSDYHAQVLGRAARIGIEAASGFGWERWLGPDGVFIGMDGFGPGRQSSPAADHFPGGAGRNTESGLDPSGGITADCISTRVLRLLGRRDDRNLNEE